MGEYREVCHGSARRQQDLQESQAVPGVGCHWDAASGGQGGVQDTPRTLGQRSGTHTNGEESGLGEVARREGSGESAELHSLGAKHHGQRETTPSGSQPLPDSHLSAKPKEHSGLCSMATARQQVVLFKGKPSQQAAAAHSSPDCVQKGRLGAACSSFASFTH